MKKAAKLLKKFFLATLVFIVVTIAFLDIGSRYYECPGTDQQPQSILVCNLDYYPVNQNKIQIIQTITELKQQGIEPSREDLDKAINLVKHEDMLGINGVVCRRSGMIFIADNLSNEGKYFVARHELEHVFRQTGLNKECDKEEYCATMSAAKIYPVGFVETILSSLYMAAKEAPTVWCFLFGSWSIFRVYILGLSDNIYF